MCHEFRFSEIEQNIERGQPGIYEIFTKSGIGLKVGISKDIRERLIEHRASRQSALKLKPGGKMSRPNDVTSKQSILAKHLYYDRTIAPEYNLKSEEGRGKFLEECCVIKARITDSKRKAKELEKQKELIGSFRYVGKVKIR
jgi:hypothetical protein